MVRLLVFQILGKLLVIDYLDRYTHRVAISNQRLLAMENGQVFFRWKDYRDGGKDKVMTLAAEEFLAACPAARLPAHPLLRLPGQLSPRP